MLGWLMTARRRRYDPIPVPTWTCEYCGFVHTPANLLRIDFDHVRCQQCGELFSDVPDSIKVKAKTDPRRSGG